MSGFTGVLAASGGSGINPACAPALYNVAPQGGSETRYVYLTIQSDGTTLATGDSPQNWALPAYAGVGAGWYVRFSSTGFGIALHSGTEGAWLSLAAGQQIAYKNSPPEVEGTGTVTIEFSRDASSVVAQLSGTIWVGNSGGAL